MTVDTPDGSPLAVPTSLSPSRLEAFVNCPLAFRFATIDKIPEPPSLPATRGSMVHRALELLFSRPSDQRDRDAMAQAKSQMWSDYQDHPDFTGLDLSADEQDQLSRDCDRLLESYWRIEDPRVVRDIGLEVRLATRLDDLELRGIIDRLELDDDGELIITDYKTGRAPPPAFERKSLSGVQFYALLCESVLGRRPRTVRLMYLRSGDVISATPTDQSIRSVQTRVRAAIDAIERACDSRDFRPRSGPLCRSCAFQRWCPEFGGDPDRAVADTAVDVPGPVRR